MKVVNRLNNETSFTLIILLTFSHGQVVCCQNCLSFNLTLQIVTVVRQIPPLGLSLHRTLASLFPADMEPGPRLNIKTVLSTYGDFHVKDKTAVRTSYL